MEVNVELNIDGLLYNKSKEGNGKLIYEVDLRDVAVSIILDIHELIGKEEETLKGLENILETSLKVIRNMSGIRRFLEYSNCTE